MEFNFGLVDEKLNGMFITQVQLKNILLMIYSSRLNDENIQLN